MYEKFKFQAAMIKSFYSVDMNSSGHKLDFTEKDVRLSVAEMLSNRQEYSYTFCQYFASRFACCCKKGCQKALARRKLHDKSISRLMRELDIVNYVRN
jgi:hypothetical protein